MVVGNEITEGKLHRGDYYRVQGHFPTIEDKMIYAGCYNYIAKFYPTIAAQIRDFTGKYVIAKVIEHFRTIMDANPSQRVKHYDWLRSNVPDMALFNRMNELISKNL